MNFVSLSTLGFEPDLLQDATGISQEALAILGFMQRVKIGRLYHFRIEQQRFEEITRVIDRYFNYYIGGNYKSLDFVGLLDDEG